MALIGVAMSVRASLLTIYLGLMTGPVALSALSYLGGRTDSLLQALGPGGVLCMLIGSLGFAWTIRRPRRAAPRVAVAKAEPAKRCPSCTEGLDEDVEGYCYHCGEPLEGALQR